MSCRRQIWSRQETLYLINLMKEKNFLTLLQKKRCRNSNIFKLIEEEMKEAGSDKNYEQIRVKWKALKASYAAVRRGVNNGDKSICPYEPELHELLSSKRISSKQFKKEGNSSNNEQDDSASRKGKGGKRTIKSKKVPSWSGKAIAQARCSVVERCRLRLSSVVWLGQIKQNSVEDMCDDDDGGPIDVPLSNRVSTARNHEPLFGPISLFRQVPSRSLKNGPFRKEVDNGEKTGAEEERVQAEAAKVRLKQDQESFKARLVMENEAHEAQVRREDELHKQKLRHQEELHQQRMLHTAERHQLEVQRIRREIALQGVPNTGQNCAMSQTSDHSVTQVCLPQN
ncbi:unnamed protein product [Timema podura]|uniref:Myb/SANT-like DNA-binding domain-containing protein n=1 Tax=Timema podura TaxID=61482 RepID=A0ABN7NPC0_TIMPD|nr:unnamed protein product [Timema podura]